MAYPRLKGLEKHPHPTTKTKEPKTYHPRLAKRRHVAHNTDPKEEGRREDEQAEDDGLGGGGIRLVDLAYEGPGVVDLHMDGPIAQPA